MGASNSTIQKPLYPPKSGKKRKPRNTPRRRIAQLGSVSHGLTARDPGRIRTVPFFDVRVNVAHVRHSKRYPMVTSALHASLKIIRISEERKPMLIALITEIIFALIALIIMISMAISFIAKKARRGESGAKKSHVVFSAILVSAACIHGIAATIYASGAHGAAYALGWAAVALLCAAGATMAAPRTDRPRPRALHIALFFASMACVIAHAVIARF